MSYAISWHQTHIQLKFIGHINGSCILDALQVMWSDSRYYNELPQLWNFNSICSLDISWQEMKFIQQFTNTHLCTKQDGRVALVTKTNKDYATSLALVAMTSRQGRLRKVFCSILLAKAWLGLTTMPPFSAIWN